MTALRVAPATVAAHDWGWRHAGRLRWAIAGLDLRIEPGERVLVVGPSGSGKSTFLHALAGVHGGDEEGESAGRLLIDEHDSRDARGRVGLLLQDPDSQVVLARVGDDVAFACENLGVPRDEIWPRVRRALDAVGLDVPLDHPTGRLSGGQKQRLALAGTLAMQPGLLLLDEPTANLDPAGVAEVRDAVRRVLDETGSTFVVVEHRVDVWVDLVGRVLVFGRDGRLIADGEPAAVLERHRDELLAAGVWVPGVPLPVPAATPVAPGTAVELAAHGLAIGRTRGRVLRRGIDAGLPSGRSTVLTGPNGAGKSTLALTLGGLLPALDGRVEASESLAAGLGRDPIAWRSKQLLTRIGTVFQEPEHQFVARTVREETAVAAGALGLEHAEARRRVDEVLDRLHLDRLADANPFTLSGGEQRRLTVASVLVARPRVVILDEPTFGQDRLTWIELVTILRELVAEGVTLLSVTHDRAYVEALGDHLLTLAAAPAGAGRDGGADGSGTAGVAA
ncbi:ABC transporter ATP-binding protein [Agromyces larvae]|uniref:Energy-coupling factor ABC transporter ATP-binding protein n=1 Tax=Agromyces larvae TaxID=2929802 RepID=A0ABY4C5H9_9MICO|nr:ABC transporter ATP-binding protein [Agromyces larvae]UOE45326.1 energy-coupling factor ABC transporter ATP-binding protein [Agromyces larvae]